MTDSSSTRPADKGEDPCQDADRSTGTPVGVRLRDLVDALTAMSDDTPLPELLHRAVTAAAQLAGARYGAVAVSGPDGVLEQSVVSGVDGPGAAEVAGVPPDLGPVERTGTGRASVRPQGADPPAAGGLPGHPAAGAVLGVPLRVQDRVLGALYLSGKDGGAAFTAEDGLLVEALAAAAAVAVDNARLAAERRRRTRWDDAFAEIRAALLSGADSDEALPLIAARARDLTGGDAALLLLPDPTAPDDQLVVMVADGRDAAELRGLRTPVAGSIAGRVYRTGEAMSIADVAAAETHEPAFESHGGYGPAVLAALGGPGEMGVLIVAKLAGTPALSPEAVAVTVDFAGHAAMALRMDDAQRTRRELALLADRERIGRDLHDQVIQRLFATGLALESIARQVTTPALQDRLRRSVDDLDQTVRDIRRSIFELQEPLDRPATLRQQIIAVLDAVLGSSPLNLQVLVADSLDAVVPPETAEQALAVLREAVSDVIRHAGATTLSVSVTAADRLRIVVTDDGTGFPAPGRHRVLAGLSARATRLGGVLGLEANPAGRGARLVWDVPLSKPAVP